MEIYRNTQNAPVTLEIPTDVTLQSVDVVVMEGGVDVFEFSTVIVTEPGKLTVTIPWHITRQDREFYIKWVVGYTLDGQAITVTETTFVQIVTPLLPLSEIAQISNLDLATQRGHVEDLERQVRHVIQSFTGQNFGKFYGIERARGSGSNKLALPAPLLEFFAMSYDGIIRPNTGIMIINDGWGLSGGEIEINSIKQAPPEWMLDRFDYTGKIFAPVKYSRHLFLDGVEYTVEGLWGYPDVPADVRQAARLLTSDYSCDESLWRDRYLDSVRAADWTFQFNPQAFTGTGNVQADQILSGYRRATMVVI